VSILTAIRNALGNQAATANGTMYPYARNLGANLSRIDNTELPAADLYRLLRAFELNNGLYQDIARSLTTVGRSTPELRAIRNPVPAVIDFWGAKLWPDPLEVEADRAGIADPIEQVWAWSNWRKNKRTFARYLALFGEAYTKTVATPERGRVYFEVISPEHVTDFAVDERDYLTMIRLDVPEVEKDRTGTRRYTHTEVWSKDRGDFRVWRTEGDACNRDVDDLGEPTDAGTLDALGIDFVPFTRTVFRDIGEPRGIGAVQLALEAIVEADLSATNLHSMVYQDAEGIWVLKSTGTDAAGRPLPPPVVASNGAGANGTGRESDGTVQVGKRSLWRLPGNSDMQSTVPEINYEAALSILKDHDEHLERLMPALAYARVSRLSGSDLSGRAIRYLLTPAIDQVTEVRANAVASLVQANQHALTMGKAAGIPEFRMLGSFEAGDFEHTIKDQQVIVVDDYEAAQADAQEAQAFQTWTSAGLPLSEALLRAGYNARDAARIVRLAESEAEAAMERQQELMAGRESDTQTEDDTDA
jgi:hypothetical protein